MDSVAVSRTMGRIEIKGGGFFYCFFFSAECSRIEERQEPGNGPCVSIICMAPPHLLTQSCDSLSLQHKSESRVRNDAATATASSLSRYPTVCLHLLALKNGDDLAPYVTFCVNAKKLFP